jgi:hypothetical protein
MCIGRFTIANKYKYNGKELREEMGNAKLRRGEGNPILDEFRDSNAGLYKLIISDITALIILIIVLLGYIFFSKKDFKNCNYLGAKDKA